MSRLAPAAPAPRLSRARHELGALLRLAAPLVFGQLAILGINTTDTVMAGRLSAEALAAVGLGSGTWSALYVFAVGAMTALSPTIAQFSGSGKTAAMTPAVRQAAWLAAVLCLLLLVALAHVEHLIRWFPIGADIRPVAVEYLHALAWGVPGLMLFLLLRNLSEGLGHTRVVLYAAFAGLAFNIVANWILIYGKFGAPALGAVGCGYATAITYWVQGLGIALYVGRSPVYAALRPLLGWTAPQGRAILGLLWIGAPVAISLFLEVSMFSAVTLLMAGFGAVTVAAHQIAFNVCAITFMVPLGLSLATTVRVGHAVGRGDTAAARRAGWTGIGTALGVQAITATLMLTLPRWIASLYSIDPTVIHAAVGFLGLAALFQLSDGIQVAASGALRGSKDTRVPMVVTVFAYWLVALPLGHHLARRPEIGPHGYWIGFFAGLSVAALLLTARYHLRTRRAAVQAPSTAESQS